MKLFDLDKLLNTLTGYIETKIELLKLDAKDELENLISKLLVSSIIVVCALIAISLLSFGLSQVLNGYLKSSYLGFLIVGVFYLLIAIVVLSKKDNLATRFKEKAREQEGLENKDSDNQNV